MSVEFGVFHEGAPSSSMATCPKQKLHWNDELNSDWDGKQREPIWKKWRGQKCAVKVEDGGNLVLGRSKNDGYRQAGRGGCRGGVAKGGVG
jgi:hypothetical protein